MGSWVIRVSLAIAVAACYETSTPRQDTAPSTSLDAGAVREPTRCAKLKPLEVSCEGEELEAACARIAGPNADCPRTVEQAADWGLVGTLQTSHFLNWPYSRYSQKMYYVN